MNEYIQNNKRSLILLSILFFLLAIVLYFMLVRPLFADLERQEINIITAQTDIEKLEETLKILNLQPDEDAFEDLMLEKIIPTTRDLDEYLLSLQQLELTTESTIEQINFVYDSQIADHEQVEDEATEDTDTADTEDAGETDDETDEADTPEDESATDSDETSEEEITLEPTFIFEKPEGLQAISVRVVAASPSFDEFINFLKAVEKSERLTIVSQLRFSHPTEHELFFEEEPQTDITFEIELTTFYYEK